MSGQRVLVVEDEGLVAMMIEDLLEDLGCEVAGSLASVPSALAWIEHGGDADGALLDVNLGGQPVFPVADALAARGVPFAFTTGYSAVPDNPHPAAPVLAKPLNPGRLKEVLAGFVRT